MQRKDLNKNSPAFDIRVYKKKLRKKHQAKRGAYSSEDRLYMDNSIFKNVVSIPEYTICSSVLCFVSMPHEIDTHKFIQDCIADGKKVAVPYCIDNSREMDFYYINSVAELKKRTFGVLEPDPSIHKKTDSFVDSICIVPGLVFDKHGYRIGYGGGYYDRFLSRKYNGLLKIGVCYETAVIDNIIRGRYDIASNYIVSENQIRKQIK